MGRGWVVWLGALLAVGCGTSSPPDGRSSQTLSVSVGVLGRTTLDGTLQDSRFVARVGDLDGGDVTDATVEVSLEGERYVVPPAEGVPGLYVQILPGYPATDLGEVEIRRGEDYLEDVVLVVLPLHRITVEERSLVVGSRVAFAWEPPGVAEVIGGIAVVSFDTDLVVASEQAWADGGTFESEVAFDAAGDWYFGMSRNLVWQLNSPESLGLSTVIVEDNLVVSP